MAKKNIWTPYKGKEGKMKLQQMLVDLGYDIGESGVDGILGKDTGKAVREFQKDLGLKADGIIGKNTIKALEGTYAANTTGTPKNKNVARETAQAKTESDQVKSSPDRRRYQPKRGPFAYDATRPNVRESGPNPDQFEFTDQVRSRNVEPLQPLRREPQDPFSYPRSYEENLLNQQAKNRMMFEMPQRNAEWVEKQKEKQRAYPGLQFQRGGRMNPMAIFHGHDPAKENYRESSIHGIDTHRNIIGYPKVKRGGMLPVVVNPYQTGGKIPRGVIPSARKAMDVYDDLENAEFSIMQQNVMRRDQNPNLVHGEPENVGRLTRMNYNLDQDLRETNLDALRRFKRYASPEQVDSLENYMRESYDKPVSSNLYPFHRDWARDQYGSHRWNPTAPENFFEALHRREEKEVDPTNLLYRDRGNSYEGRVARDMAQPYISKYGKQEAERVEYEPKAGDRSSRRYKADGGYLGMKEYGDIGGEYAMNKIGGSIKDDVIRNAYKYGGLKPYQMGGSMEQRATEQAPQMQEQGVDQRIMALAQAIAQGQQDPSVLENLSPEIQQQVMVMVQQMQQQEQPQQQDPSHQHMRMLADKVAQMMMGGRTKGYGYGGRMTMYK